MNGAEMSDRQPKAAFCQPECDWTVKVTHMFGAMITLNTCAICGRYDAFDVDQQIYGLIAEVVKQTKVENERSRLALKMAYDLDRCPHGRHEGDVCSGWRGPGLYDGGCRGGYSRGNPHIKTGQVFGYGISGFTRYVLPERAKGDFLNYIQKESGQ